jgi:hypothetical protein
MSGAVFPARLGGKDEGHEKIFMSAPNFVKALRVPPAAQRELPFDILRILEIVPR